MFNIIKKVFLVVFISNFAYATQVGVVDTDILLIKKNPSNTSVKFGFYKINKVIDILSSSEGIDSEDMWYKTPRGYVKSKYVILEKDLPKFISEDEIDYSKNALQLIVYQSTVVESLQKLRKILKDEKYIYLEKTKNVFVIYLVNFESYSMAELKRKEIKKYFSSAFITKIKDKRIDKLKIDKIDKEEEIVYDDTIKTEEIELLKDEVISEEELNSMKIDLYNIEKIEIVKPEEIKVDKIKEKIIITQINEEIIPDIEKKIIVKNKQTYQSIMENLLIHINK